MRHHALSTCVLMLAASAASATTVSGTVTYAGQAIGASFSNLGFGVTVAIDQQSGAFIEGTADPATGTYQITGLSPGSYSVRVLFGANDFGGRTIARSGELWASDTVDIGSETPVTLDLEAQYAYRIRQPFDSAGEWPGGFTACPEGGAAPAEFTLAWDPVPLVDHYRVRVIRSRCGDVLESTNTDTSETSLQIQQGTVTGETYLVIIIIGFSADGSALTTSPTIQYEDGSAQGALVHRDFSERASHPVSAVFVPQVARLPGVAPSFWTSDVVLTNPTTEDVDATLVYTPRDADGLTDYLTATATVPAGGCRVLSDVVGSLFGTQGAGSLEVLPADVQVTSRISTPAEGGGSFGQGFPAVASDGVASLAGPVTSLGVGGIDRPAFRPNLVLTEVWGDSVDVEVAVLDRDGGRLGATTVDLRPFETTQLNDVVGMVGAPHSLSEGQVTVEVTAGDGRVAAVLSLVDTSSDDPTTLVLEPR